MKRIFSVVFLLMFVLGSMPAYAEKGASPVAYQHASDEAVFHRVGDWFATIGKSGAEKDQLLAERKAQRMARKAEKNGRQEKSQR